MGLLSPKMKDDRGDLVRVFDPGGLNARRDLELSLKEFATLRSEIFPRTNVSRKITWREAAPVLLALAICVVVLSVVVINFGPGPSRAWSIFFWPLSAVMFVIITACAQVGWRARLRRLHPQIRSTMINHDRCPACGYLLTTLQPDEDGCTVCPECGAAWRLKGAGL